MKAGPPAALLMSVDVNIKTTGMPCVKILHRSNSVHVGRGRRPNPRKEGRIQTVRLSCLASGPSVRVIVEYVDRMVEQVTSASLVCLCLPGVPPRDTTRQGPCSTKFVSKKEDTTS